MINELELPPRKPVTLPPPCPICGEQEREVGDSGVFKIRHNYALHEFPPSAADRGNGQ